MDTFIPNQSSFGKKKAKLVTHFFIAQSFNSMEKQLKMKLNYLSKEKEYADQTSVRTQTFLVLLRFIPISTFPFLLPEKNKQIKIIFETNS